jgi:hypothetical protein
VKTTKKFSPLNRQNTNFDPQNNGLPINDLPFDCLTFYLDPEPSLNFAYTIDFDLVFGFAE